MKTAVIIPSRMNSSRLPGKMLMKINNKPLLYYTWKKAVESQVGDVFIAAADEEIISEMRKYHAICFKVPNNLNSGTDAVFYCYHENLRGKYDVIVNLQGDTPTISPEFIKYSVEPLEYYDIGTLCYETDIEEAQKPQVVKIALSPSRFRENLGQAIYFSRSPVPFNSKKYYHHIGIYSFMEHSLREFCSLEPSELEKIEKLEQLRALENNMTIGVRIVEKTNIYGIDTMDDFLKFKREMRE